MLILILVLVSTSGIADNAANIASNSAAISSNDADILSISDNVGKVSILWNFKVADWLYII